MLRLQSLVFSVLLAANVGIAPTSVEAFDYNPAECATDPQGMVYLALGRTVLRFPAEAIDLERIFEPLWPAELAAAPPPPDPSQPPGCPGHPIQAYGFLFNDKYDDPVAFPHDRLMFLQAFFDLWETQPLDQQWYDYTCAQQGLREELPNGLVACYWPPDDRAMPRAYWPARYRARPEVYATPLGRPFILDCLMGNPRSGSRACLARYRIDETVTVAYRVNAQNVPFDTILDYDRSLRATFEAARVADYMWADEDAPQSGREGGE